MKYGYFDDDAKEYVITRPDTPLPWINYLGSEDFYGIISNTAGGYCFFRDARLRRLTRYRYNNIPLDSNGRYLYIDDGSGAWTPMWKPMRSRLDRYECRHGMGYTSISGEKDGLAVQMTCFIPLYSRHEVWQVRLTNLTQTEKKIRLWGFVEWCLWDALDDMTNFQRNFSTGQVETGNNAIFHITEYRERRNHYAYFSVNRQTSGFDTSRDAFVGVHNGLDAPQAVMAGSCSNSQAYGWAPVGVHQIDLNLAPGVSDDVIFLLGYAENPAEHKYNADGTIRKDEFNLVAEKYKQTGSAQQSLAELKQYWQDLLNIYQVHTEDEVINRMANIWHQYQCMVTFNMSRSASLYESGVGRGIGFRDSNQDILGFVHMVPQRAKNRLLELAATQLSDGTCFHQYQPLTKQGNADIGGGFNDDPLWLVLATAAYIRETGDTKILSAPAGFADKKDSSATLLDHLHLSIKYTREHLGPHGLPLIGHADWNDCLNLNCFSTEPGESFQLAGHIENDKVAESLMIAGLFCRACDDMAGILNSINKTADSKKYLQYALDMRRVILDHGWDGEWFLRAYDAFGRKVGSHENDEGKIFIESQGWCILGGVGLDNGYAQTTLASVKQHLATPDGIVLQQPAFSTYYEHLGEVSSYPPGYKENAGIFNHNNPWIQIAETILGNGAQAMAYYKSICPAVHAEKIEVYRAEPYVYSQMTAGRDAPTPGEAKNSWLTGTAAWTFLALSQYILGIQTDFNGLRIDPCIPPEWTGFTVRRVFRNAVYNIAVKNHDHVSKGVKSILADGQRIEGNILPDFKDGREHEIIVTLGN